MVSAFVAALKKKKKNCLFFYVTFVLPVICSSQRSDMIMVHLTVNEPLLLETCLVYCFLMFSSHRCVFFCYLLPPPALPLPRHLTLSFVHQPPPISAQRGQALSVWCKNLLPVKMLTHCCPWDWLTGKKGGKLTLQPLVFNFPCLTVFFFFLFSFFPL